jgi:hypothetical protein
MFKLYINIAGWQKIKIPFYTEQEVVQAMINCKNKYNNFYFMVIERLDNTDDVKVVTRSEEDFNNYIQEVQEKYSNRVEDNLSAVELKRLILERVKL